MTARLMITRGLPASGKTSWARAQIDSRATGEIVRLNRDDLRASMLPTGYRQPEYRAEQLITIAQHTPIVDLLRGEVDVIVDDTNLRSRTVREFAKMAERANAQWECVDDFLGVPVEECIRRDANRPNSVGEDVIRRMWRKYLSGGRTLSVPVLDTPVTGNPYTPKPGSTPAVLVDVDGTVALHGSRDPYDTSRYHEDTPNWPVVTAVQHEAAVGSYKILFCSGRSEEFRDVTERWIDQHVLPCRMWELFMRPAGDTRNDAVVKLELFDRHVRDHYDVRRVYDDRARVVAAWRSIGLTVFAVADGSF